MLSCNFLRRCLGGRNAYMFDAWNCWSHWNAANSSTSWRNNIANFSHLTPNLYFGFIHIPLLLSFLSNTFGHRRPRSWPNCFWSRCDLTCGQSARGGRSLRIRNLVDPLQLSERVLFSSVFHYASMIVSSTSSKLVCCISRQANVFERNWEW